LTVATAECDSLTLHSGCLTLISAMEVAKRLDFDPTDTLTSLQEAAQQRFHSANMAALKDLQQ